MHALGRGGLPSKVEFGERAFELARFIKHDFFAATGFYRDPSTGETVVIKIGRTEPIFGLPAVWIGRWLTRREVRFYQRLADLPNVPALIGRVGRTGLIHAYVPGRPLQKGMTIPDPFFDELLGLVDAAAARGVAIVDTNKPENILLGDDGRPHLIDFQISYDVRDLRGVWPAGPILRLFWNTDRYHVLKHKSRLRPDLTTPAELSLVTRVHWAIRLHRRINRPYLLVRRRLFAHLRAKGRLMPEGSK